MVCQRFDNFSIPSAKNYGVHESRKRLTSFMTLSFEWKIVRSRCSCKSKTDCNPKAPCLACVVDVASNPTPGCRVSSWSGVILKKENNLSF
ncbi:hypothetical protein TNCV_2051991 [Trichonephila clavipes]|nr:hypothetical protein TNCV_2051991 [Trichonephila clavipes]